MTGPRPTPIRRSLRLLSLFAATSCLAGCAGFVASAFAPEGAAVNLSSLGPAPTSLDALLPHGSYEVRLWEESFYCSDLPLDELLAGGVRDGQFLHVQLLWWPKAGQTPVRPDSTNVVLRYVVVSDGKVGLYGGGGFAWPRGRAGTHPMTLVIRGSNLVLLAFSEGFVDPLTPARLEGTVQVRPDDETTRRYRRGVSQLVTDALSESRWVDATGRPLDADQVLALLRPVSDTSAARAAGIDGSVASR